MGSSKPAHSLYFFLLFTTHICFPIILLKHFLNITLPVKDFTSQLVVGYSPFITIILSVIRGKTTNKKIPRNYLIIK